MVTKTRRNEPQAGAPPAPDAEDAVIEAVQLTKRYGDFVAVDALDLTIRRGEVFGLLGPNGAGKTTTILMMLGLTEPSAGSVRVDGLNPTREPLAVKSRVGYLPDEVGFYTDMTARQNLRYTAMLNRVPRGEIADRIDQLLVDVGLDDARDKRVGTFSRGMLQRLGLADALVKRPTILVLDEPTVNIDPEGVRELLLLVERLRTDQGVTVLLSSHLLHQVEQVCDRIGVFVHGKLVDRAGGDAALAAMSGVTNVHRSEGRWHVTAERDVRDDVQRFVQTVGAHLTHLSRDGADLDAIYHRYLN